MDERVKISNGHEDAARQSLETIEKVAARAEDELAIFRPSGAGTMASVNTFTSTDAISTLGRVTQATRNSANILKDEPAIARVVVETEDGDQKTYYICRAMPIGGVGNLASYHSPLGRMASLRPGSEFTLPGGQTVEIVERYLLYPKHLSDGWDSVDTIAETAPNVQQTVRSLRQVLLGYLAEGEADDLIAQLLAQDNAQENIFDGTRRNRILRMELRDQPVLDEFQDKVFRLPLNSYLLLLGPPGTGKTTTLIRRLAQKAVSDYLSEEEKTLIDQVASADNVHARNWVMFTPTELLKLYLKEAFARENIAASDRHLQTWDQFRHDVARNVVPILRTGSTGIFTLRTNAPHLLTDTQAKCTDWFSDFDNWQHAAWLEQLKNAAEALQQSDDREARAIGIFYLDILASSERRSLGNLLSSLLDGNQRLALLISEFQKAIDDVIRKGLNTHYRKSPGLLSDLARFLETLAAVDTEALEDADAEADEDEEAPVPRSAIEGAVYAYTQAVRAYARAVSMKRSMPRGRNGRIIEWLRQQNVELGDLVTIGQQLLILRNARQINQPVRQYFNNLPKRYRSFRRDRQTKGQWYGEITDHRDIIPLEVDIVLLSLLKAGQSLADRPDLNALWEQSGWAAIKPIVSLWRNQVLVDEAPDFSPIQLRCMASLSHPHIRSFFACGDFNQRLTEWGSRGLEAIRWAAPKIEAREVTIGYRQSQQLNLLARSLIELRGEEAPSIVLPEHVDSDAAWPALLENSITMEASSVWVAQRICEIEKEVGQLPSIAVFVNSEDEVEPCAALLREALISYNINVTAAVRGEIIGQANDVRVFDIRHIKGLEFEAAFFIGLDELAHLHPELIDKYLYVGITRAATYLGLTNFGAMPEFLAPLAPQFVDAWS